ncbi:hypothetical protein BGZ54_005986, partial [Gamsiella multidivaricata]
HPTMKFTALVAAFLAPAVAMAALTNRATLANRAALANEAIPAVANDVPVKSESLVHIMASKQGQLTVKLNYATKLTNKDWLGKSDPYVELWLEKDHKQRSKDGKGLNPVFNQAFTFYVRSGQSKLYVRVVDKDTFSDDKIGEATISLDEVFNTGNVGARDYKLPKWFGLRNNGYVNLEL